MDICIQLVIDKFYSYILKKNSEDVGAIMCIEQRVGVNNYSDTCCNKHH